MTRVGKDHAAMLPDPFTGFANFWFIEHRKKLSIHFEPAGYEYSAKVYLFNFVIEHGRKAQGWARCGDLTKAILTGCTTRTSLCGVTM